MNALSKKIRTRLYSLVHRLRVCVRALPFGTKAFLATLRGQKFREVETSAITVKWGNRIKAEKVFILNLCDADHSAALLDLDYVDFTKTFFGSLIQESIPTQREVISPENASYSNRSVTIIPPEIPDTIQNLHSLLNFLLKLPVNSILILSSPSTSALQRRIIINLLESGFWSIAEFRNNQVVIERHSSIRTAPDSSSSSSNQTGIPNSFNSTPLNNSSVKFPILSTYFCESPNPQGSGQIEKDNFDLIKPWAESIADLQLNGIIFHDGLTDEFVNRHQSNHLIFVRVPPSSTLSVNDYRFLIWRDWLSANPFETVFFSDLFDVVVNRDPFELFETPTLFISHQGKKIGETEYFLKNFSRVYGRVPERLLGQPELNAGVWGGGYNEALRFLVLISSEIQNLATGPVRSYNVNMPAFNHVAYSYFGRENFWVEGEPLHSEFKKYQVNANVAFIHK